MKISVFFIALAITGAAHAETIRVNGSTTVNPVVAEAAEILRKEKGMTIQVDTQGGSSGGITALGEGRIDLAMSSRAINDGDLSKYPNVDFVPLRIGEDAVAMIVSKDVWDGGTKALSKQQMQSIYERKVKNWKQLGGKDRRIAFFNKEPGRGTWEVFVKWLYGKTENAPRVAHPEVGANEEARSKVAGSRGAISQLSASWVDNKTIFALGVKTDAGIIRPEAKNIIDGSYPLSRPLFVITNGEPTGGTKVLIDFLLSDEGQKLVTKHGYLTLAQLEL